MTLILEKIQIALIILYFFIWILATIEFMDGGA